VRLNNFKINLRTTLMGGLTTGGLMMGATVHAIPQLVRWTAAEDVDASFEHVLTVLSSKTGQDFNASLFRLNEQRALAYSNFAHYPQQAAGVDVEGASLRIWSDRETGKLIQVEAFVETPASVSKSIALFKQSARARGFYFINQLPMGSGEALSIATAALLKHEDHKVSTHNVHFVLRGSRVVGIAKLKAERGQHTVEIDALTQKVLRLSYEPHPTGELAPIPVDLYPYYEEFEGKILPRERFELTDLLDTVNYSSVDPFSPLRDMTYLYSKMNDVMAATPEGRAQGYWSMAGLNGRVKTLASAMNVYPNRFDQSGVRLAGKYCQVMIHPEAIKQFQNLPFTPVYSGNVGFDWLDVTNAAGQDDYEIKVLSSYYGKPLQSREEALSRPANRYPFHDPRQYFVEGFDEMQVYHSVNTFFKTLHQSGFSDPELSTRPFTAYLFNPDIIMRDNAFYTNDTINFTTYSPQEGNMARDSLTIWHELGHGLMDRLMDDGTGRFLVLADTGGLSEGMADFVADLILYGTKEETDFPGRAKQRIINRTGFLLTNEVHDDGEAYGGVMHDILQSAYATLGRAGIQKMTDLTMETMRLTRFHPRLTAADFFDHMQFADQLGRPGLREPGEFTALIRQALARRNFEVNMADAAKFSIKYLGKEVSKGELGSRGHEVTVTLPENGVQQFTVDLGLSDGAGFKWIYPVTLKAFKANRGALQGAVHWTGEGNLDTEVETTTLNHAGDIKSMQLEVSGKCDQVNRPDGSCSDYVYFLMFNGGDTSGYPTAKKRFYVKVKPTAG
jgi:hypothetical protein